MQKLTIYDTSSEMKDLVNVQITHVCMFNGSEMSIHFIGPEEQMKLITCFIKQFVKFWCQGSSVVIDMAEFQRVKMRINA